MVRAAVLENLGKLYDQAKQLSWMISPQLGNSAWRHFEGEAEIGASAAKAHFVPLCRRSLPTSTLVLFANAANGRSEPFVPDAANCTDDCKGR